jgi:hypothetical protein
MKTQIFEAAIRNRNRISFIYNFIQVFIEPYYMTFEKDGSKVLYGKILQNNEIKKFDLNKIANIKVVEGRKFAPIVQLIPVENEKKSFNKKIKYSRNSNYLQ